MEFTYFAKKVLPQLKALKRQFRSFKAIKSASNSNNKQLMTLLDKYEELNLSNYSENNPDKLVLGDPKSKDTKE